MITVRSTINLAHQSVPEVIPAVQGDTGRSILFTLADFTIPTGATARYFITKPSGLAVYNDATIDGNTVLVDLTAQSLAEYGDCPGQVRIMFGQTVVTSFEFILHVEPFRGIDAVESTTETNIFDKAVEDAREAIAEAAEDAEEYISQALDTTLTIPDKAADAKATGDAIRYGAYPFLTAGQLLSTHETTDNTPYNYRVVEQESTLEYGKIVGGTVAWNQLVKNGDFSSGATNWSVFSSNYSTISASGNKLTQSIKAVSAQTSAFLFGVNQSNVIKDATHKHFCRMRVKPSFGTNLKVELGGGTVHTTPTISANTESEIAFVSTAYTSSASILVYPYSGVYNVPTTGNETIEYSSVTIIDLTQMLGTTLADYIYGLESATAGAGVAWLRKHFPKMFTYHAYNAGSLQSVEGLSHHVTNGFNQWDEEWEYTTRNGMTSVWTKNYVPVIGGVTYCISVPSVTNAIKINQYDANKQLINTSDYSVTNYKRIITLADNCRYILVGFNSQYGTTYSHDICINISDPSRNGEYRPYASHAYPLDDSLTLRGIFKLDSSNRLYADGDRYLPDGTVQRRYGVVDLGTLNWTMPEDAPLFLADITDSKNKQNSVKANAVCSHYIILPVTSYESDPIVINVNKSLAVGFNNYSRLYLHDSAYTDAATLKASLSGVYLVYELATPTTETADPYTDPQIVAPGGTEEYVSTSVVPVGHESSYPLDIAGQLDKILDTPTADGTYTLRATVSGGKVTYSWVSGGNTLMSMRPMQTVIDEPDDEPEEEEPVEE